jgi:membrane protein implicated in regulation of membrane protease activity
MDNAIGAGIFILWFGMKVATIGGSYLISKGKGRNPIGWTIAACFLGLVVVVVLLFLKPSEPEQTLSLDLNPAHDEPGQRGHSVIA